MRLQYRPDIDGLRALAVVAVVVYHFFPDFLVGGFVGVDIFFVISGYLVTGILLQENSKDSFNLWEFYRRRIRRLFPALIVVVFCCLVFGAFFLLAEEFMSLGLHAFFASLFSSNFLLSNEVGYFDGSTLYKPLMHFWSLSVEEQFYLIWPFIIWCSFRFKGLRLIFVFSILTLFSFLFNILYIQIDQILTFYSIGSRVWELGIGGLLAIFKFKELVPCARIYKNTFSIVGLIGVFASVFI